MGAIALPATPASAGGGCHSDPTSGSGETVEMVGACFTPTTLRIDPGATVTFVNRDPMTHDVTANGWGRFEPMTEGDAFTVAFDEAGIYPYACTYHPGMTGAIVVGDGRPVTAASAEVPSPPSGTAVLAAGERAAPAAGSSPGGWVAAAGAGMVVGFGTGLAVRRFGRRTTATE